MCTASTVIRKKITSNDAEKYLKRIHQLLIVKTHSKLGIKGNFLNFVKNIYKNLQLSSSLMWGTQCFSPETGKNVRMFAFTTPLPYHIGSPRYNTRKGNRRPFMGKHR